MKTKVLLLDESNKRKYKVRSSDFEDFDYPDRVFIVTNKEKNNLTVDVKNDDHGFTECYKRTKGNIKQVQI